MRKPEQLIETHPRLIEPTFRPDGDGRLARVFQPDKARFRRQILSANRHRRAGLVLYRDRCQQPPLLQPLAKAPSRSFVQRGDGRDGPRLADALHVQGRLDAGGKDSRADRRSDLEKLVLLYAGTCSRCRFLSLCIVIWSLGRVKRVPLDVPQWQKLYDEHLPDARGFPVLVLEEGPIYGKRVFLVVPLVVFQSWVLQPLKLIFSFLRRNWAAERHEP